MASPSRPCRPRVSCRLATLRGAPSELYTLSMKHSGMGNCGIMQPLSPCSGSGNAYEPATSSCCRPAGDFAAACTCGHRSSAIRHRAASKGGIVSVIGAHQLVDGIVVGLRRRRQLRVQLLELAAAVLKVQIDHLPGGFGCEPSCGMHFECAILVALNSTHSDLLLACGAARGCACAADAAAK